MPDILEGSHERKDDVIRRVLQASCTYWPFRVQVTCRYLGLLALTLPLRPPPKQASEPSPPIDEEQRNKILDQLRAFRHRQHRDSSAP